MIAAVSDGSNGPGSTSSGTLRAFSRPWENAAERPGDMLSATVAVPNNTYRAECETSCDFRPAHLAKSDHCRGKRSRAFNSSHLLSLPTQLYLRHPSANSRSSLGADQRLAAWQVGKCMCRFSMVLDYSFLLFCSLCYMY